MAVRGYRKSEMGGGGESEMLLGWGEFFYQVKET